MSQFNMTKKKQNSGDDDGNTMIQIMTVSLFIILLAFFILLNSIAVVDQKKQRKVIGSIVENFGGIDPEEVTTGNFPETVFTNGVSPVEFKDLVAGKDKRLKDITIQSTKRRTVLTVPSELLFLPYKMQLKRSGRRFLKKLSGVIKENKFPVDITCHLDDEPVLEIAGISSRELTTLRSIRVLRYFIESGKLPAKQFTASGWGQQKSRFSNKTAKTRKMNRRIDITFVHDQAKSSKRGFFIFKDFFFNVEN